MLSQDQRSQVDKGLDKEGEAQGKNQWPIFVGEKGLSRVPSWSVLKGTTKKEYEKIFKKSIGGEAEKKETFPFPVRAQVVK